MQRMSAREADGWHRRYLKYGTFSTTRKLEQMIGPLTMITARAAGVKDLTWAEVMPTEAPEVQPRQARRLTQAEHETMMRNMAKQYDGV